MLNIEIYQMFLYAKNAFMYLLMIDNTIIKLGYTMNYKDLGFIRRFTDGDYWKNRENIHHLYLEQVNPIFVKDIEKYCIQRYIEKFELFEDKKEHFKKGNNNTEEFILLFKKSITEFQEYIQPTLNTAEYETKLLFSKYYNKIIEGTYGDLINIQIFENENRMIIYYYNNQINKLSSISFNLNKYENEDYDFLKELIKKKIICNDLVIDIETLRDILKEHKKVLYYTTDYDNIYDTELSKIDMTHLLCANHSNTNTIPKMLNDCTLSYIVWMIDKEIQHKLIDGNYNEKLYSIENRIINLFSNTIFIDVNHIYSKYNLYFDCDWINNELNLYNTFRNIEFLNADPNVNTHIRYQIDNTYNSPVYIFNDIVFFHNKLKNMKEVLLKYNQLFGERGIEEIADGVEKILNKMRSKKGFNQLYEKELLHFFNNTLHNIDINMI